MSRRRPKHAAPDRSTEPQERIPAVSVVYDQRGGFRLVTVQLSRAELDQRGTPREPDGASVVLAQAEATLVDAMREQRGRGGR